MEHQERVLRDEATACEAGVFDVIDDRRLYPAVLQDYQMRLMDKTPLFAAPAENLSMSRG